MNTDVLIPALFGVTLVAGAAFGIWQIFKVRRSQERRGHSPDDDEALKRKIGRPNH